MNNTENADKNSGGVGAEFLLPAQESRFADYLTFSSRFTGGANTRELADDLAKEWDGAAYIRTNLLDEFQAIAEAARDFIWEPENWEAYELSKRSNSVAWPPEFLLLAQAVEKKYGAMPLGEPCEICHAKTVAAHDPDCPNNAVWDSGDSTWLRKE